MGTHVYQRHGRLTHQQAAVPEHSAQPLESELPLVGNVVEFGGWECASGELSLHRWVT